MIHATCETCGAVLSASDEATLAWGLDTHVCAASSPTHLPFGEAMRGFSDRDHLETTVVCWLVGVYAGPLWWFRRDAAPLVVT